MPSFRDLVMEMLAGRPRSQAASEFDVDIDFDELSATAPAVAPPAPAREGMWKQSSFDLLHGLEVSEEPMETMPDELIDAFFKR